MKTLIPPPVVVAIFAGAMWLLARYVEPGRFSFSGQIVLAAALLAVAVALMFAAVLSFARARTTVNPMRPARASTLVTSGVFAWSRNPIYLGSMASLLGMSLWLPSLAVLGAWGVVPAGGGAAHGAPPSRRGMSG